MRDNRHEPPTVLVVEDEQGLAELYEDWLGDSYAIRTAYDGAQALQFLDESVSVVVLDRRLPEVSGDEVLNRIREEGIDCCVVMVTAVDPDFDVLELGFDDYVYKPLLKKDLQETVARMVALVTHDQDVRDYYGLVAKKVALDEVKSASELETNEDYVALEAEIDESRARIEAERDITLDDDFAWLFREPI